VAKLEQLLKAVEDAELKAQLESEVATLKGRTRFGLVYERHIPETVIVGDTDGLKVGDHVRRREEANNGHDYRVVALNGKKVKVVPANGGMKSNGGTSEMALKDLLVVKPFGEPAYLGLASQGATRRSEARPSHTVIDGENFHALQALALAYEGQVDCIYIDPPYNTGARDWTYNNHYVDSNDSYRHSKWLSMMEKRLKIARRLLKPDGVLICTIDENELAHLGLLLEGLFPDARRQIVTVCINPGGAAGEGLSRVEEYAFFCFLGDAEPAPTDDDMLVAGVDTQAAHTGARGIRWEWLMRGGNAWYRASRRNLCYPILLSEDTTEIVGTGEPLEGEDDDRPLEIDGHPVAWPVRRDGKLGIWRVDAARLMWLKEKGYAFVSARDEPRGTWTVKYLMSGTVENIESGAIEVVGRGERGEVQVRLIERRSKTAKTMWYRGRHIAGGAGGTHLLNALLGERNLFSFPKSVYVVRDALEIAVGERPDALILDYFAGSGTTLNATCLLNAEDGGSRRSILVTNNEVSPERTRKLNRDGHFRGDPQFERQGIFEAVAKPRCEAVITGKRADGATVEGTYLDGRLYADGFEENVEFFRLDYLDPDDVELGNCFESIHPLLWLAAGGRGERPAMEKDVDYLLAPECGYAVLFNEDAFRNFEQALQEADGISHVFLATDSDEAYAEMRERLGSSVQTGMLYRDFLRHFRRRLRA
jgi:adenine-specific DNA-methyltransferase